MACVDAPSYLLWCLSGRIPSKEFSLYLNLPSNPLAIGLQPTKLPQGRIEGRAEHRPEGAFLVLIQVFFSGEHAGLRC